jgi:site-specific DNA recombinase
MNKNAPKPASTLPLVRCAIYTRKSTEEGLEQEFNSLDAQRESAQAFIASQQHEGWTCLPDRYDDGGFTGGNMERPALQRLLADIAEGKVDCVVVYKVDRLSRSLLDFAKMMETFERHRASFVSITQQFNSATSMGRLVLNVLLSFAQFEREIISERTRDKIAATRRKGKWSGGTPILGYDVDPRGGRLLVNDEEAVRVRAIFQLYLEYQALLPVVQELERRGWVGKRWQTRQGHERGGRPFTRTSLYRLLTNVVYLGKSRYKNEVHAGEHAAIVDAQVFQQVQTLLRQNGSTGGAAVRNEFGAVLKGLLRCVPCGCSMSPSHTTRNGTKRYRYYVCSSAAKAGRKTCPAPSIPAGEIERFVVERIRAIGADPALQQQVFAQARQQDEACLSEWEAERRGLEKDLARWHAQLRAHVPACAGADEDGATLAWLTDTQERIRGAEQQLLKLREQMCALRQRRLDADEVALALTQFGPVWESLAPREQARLVQLLIEKVEYDGVNGRVAIAFYPTGIKTLAEELMAEQQLQLKEKRA